MPTLTCPSCSSEVPAGAHYCLACGAKLAVIASEGMARCAQHPDIAAAQTCSRCGNFACSACLVVRSSGALVCTVCAAREPDELLPWDRREQLGTLSAYWKTCLRLLQAPGKALSAAPPHGSLGSSILFSLVSAFAGILPTMVVYALFMGVIFNQLAKTGAGKTQDLPGWVMPAIFGGYGIIGPLFTVGAMLVLSLLDHVVLKLVGARPAPWPVTFRGTALAMAPYLLGLIPVCGLYVYPIWWLVLKVFAYKGLHRTTTGKAAAGALVPALGLGLCCFAGYFAVLFAALAKGK